MFCFSSRWFEFFSWLERTAKGYQMLDWCKNCWLSSLQCQDWAEQFTMLTSLVNAYSSYWKFFDQTIIFWILLGAISPPFWHIDWCCENLTRQVRSSCTEAAHPWKYTWHDKRARLHPSRETCDSHSQHTYKRTNNTICCYVFAHVLAH